MDIKKDHFKIKINNAQEGQLVFDLTGKVWVYSGTNIFAKGVGDAKSAIGLIVEDSITYRSFRGEFNDKDLPEYYLHNGQIFSEKQIKNSTEVDGWPIDKKVAPGEHLVDKELKTKLDIKFDTKDLIEILEKRGYEIKKKLEPVNIPGFTIDFAVGHLELGTDAFKMLRPYKGIKGTLTFTPDN